MNAIKYVAQHLAFFVVAFVAFYAGIYWGLR